MNLLRATVDFFRSFASRRKHLLKNEPHLEHLQRRLGHHFNDQSLLRQALTHKSSISPEKWLLSNERLEFLGDAVLNCCITEYLFRQYPSMSEGQLSKIKSLMVSRKILGEVGLDMGLGDHLILGYSERKTGGRERLSVVSNAFEAIIGAMYMDGGLEPARRFLEKYLFCHIDESCKKEDNINYKSWILEQSQRDGFGIPKYTVIGTSGPEHAKEFSVRIAIGGISLGEGSGPNKKIAQQRAAYTASLNYSKETILSHIKGEREHELVSH